MSNEEMAAYLIDNDLKYIKYNMEHDEAWVATFVRWDGTEEEFVKSREKVFEHIRKMTSSVEIYENNKSLQQAHFQVWARHWFVVNFRIATGLFTKFK